MATEVVRVKGLDELKEKLEGDFAKLPSRRFLSRVGITVQGKARRKAPVDRGLLRNSIAHEVDAAEFPRYVRVGTNIHYAPSMEGGTGLLSDLPGGTGTRHWPPGSVLDAWAVRHGWVYEDPESGESFPPGQLVAEVIGKRGGLKPRRFLRDGFQDSLAKIEGSYVPKLAMELEKEASRGVS